MYDQAYLEHIIEILYQLSSGRGGLNFLPRLGRHDMGVHGQRKLKLKCDYFIVSSILWNLESQLW
jgi:hypothetical protein